MTADLEAPSLGSLQILIMSIARNVIAQQIIQVSIQPSPSHHAAVFALERTAGCITRISKKRFLVALTLGIEPLERGPRHQHLASDLKLLGPVSPFGQLERNGVYRAHVCCDIISLYPISASNSPLEASVLIVKTDAQPIKLQLATNLERVAMQPFAHSAIEVCHFLTIISVCQAEHRSLMNYRLKLITEIRPHPLSRTVGVCHLWMPPFQILQLAHHLVKFLIRDNRCVQHIIIIIMSVELIPQAKYLLLFVHKSSRSITISYSSRPIIMFLDTLVKIPQN